MKIISLFGVVNLPEMQEAAVEVLASSRIASGEYITRFESGFGELIENPHVVSTFDMTSAMFLALHLSGVGPGDEVLTTSYACMATNSAIAQRGATPVWVDLRPQSLEIDLADFESKITSKTKAAILYHVAGYPGPAREMARICERYGIALIEDCDNALFATREGRPVGSHGRFAVYSFYPNRQINTTEGGALSCRNAEDAAHARRLRRFGIDPASFRMPNGEINPLADIAEVGWAFTMNNLCAAMGCAQLPTAYERVAKTRENVRRLMAGIDGLSGVRPASAASASDPAFWVLMLLVDQRDKVMAAMKHQGIYVSSVHQRNDVYSGFRAKPALLPNTAWLQDHVLALPCGWWLSGDDVDAITEALRKALSAPLAA